MKQQMKHLILIAVLGGLSATTLVAQEGTLSRDKEAKIEPMHGVEFTFTNPRLIRKGLAAGLMAYGSEANMASREQWAAKMAKICDARPASHPDKCEVHKEKKKKSMNIYTVVYKHDGWSYSITIDPLVIEINASPMTTAEAIKLRDRMQRDIFDMAKKVISYSANKTSENVGLTPHERIGGGHIHFDLLTSFRGDTLLFRNFLVDYANHPTLSLGSLCNDPQNGPPLAILSPEQRQAFYDVVHEFDYYHPDWSIKKLAQEITDRVYTSTRSKPGIFTNRNAWTPVWKYQAVNISRIVKSDIDPDERTMEIRALQPQKSADYFIKVIQLFDARLNMLKKLNKPIPYLRAEMKEKSIDKEPQRVVDELYAYVHSSGLNFEDYKEFIPAAIMEQIEKGKVACREAGAGVESASPMSYDHENFAFRRIYQDLLTRKFSK